MPVPQHGVEEVDELCGVSKSSHVQQEAASHSIGECACYIQKEYGDDFFAPPHIFDVMSQI